MSQRDAPLIEQNQQRKPPMPEFLVKLVNPLIKLMLNSPLHRQISRRLMLLYFTGRKTGKHYSTPVGYVQQRDKMFVFTHSSWRNNFKQSAPVKMRIQGKDIHGTARWIHDTAQIKQMIQALISANGEEMSRRMGFWVPNLHTASPDAVQQATKGTYFIEIEVYNEK